LKLNEFTRNESGHSVLPAAHFCNSLFRNGQGSHDAEAFPAGNELRQNDLFLAMKKTATIHHSPEPNSGAIIALELLHQESKLG
jgi:hypothetical protein